MQDFQEVIDTDLNNNIISDEICDGKPVKDMTNRGTHITASIYHKYDFEKVAEACTNLDKEERKKLYLLLKKYELVCDGTLGIYNTDPVDILLKEYMPHHIMLKCSLRQGHTENYLRKKLNNYVN